MQTHSGQALTEIGLDGVWGAEVERGTKRHARFEFGIAITDITRARLKELLKRCSVAKVCDGKLNVHMHTCMHTAAECVSVCAGMCVRPINNNCNSICICSADPRGVCAIVMLSERERERETKTVGGDRKRADVRHGTCVGVLDWTWVWFTTWTGIGSGWGRILKA